MLSAVLTAVAAGVLLPWAVRPAKAAAPCVMGSYMTGSDGFRLGFALVVMLSLAMPAVGHTLLGRADPGGFGTLSLGARLGLLALSTALLLVLLWLGALKTRWLIQWRVRWPWAPLLDLAAAATLAAAAITLGGQVFYEYYRLVIPGLPAQWVITGEPWWTVTDALPIWRDGPLGRRISGAAFWAVILAGPVAQWLAHVEPKSPSRPASALFGAALALALHGVGVAMG